MSAVSYRTVTTTVPKHSPWAVAGIVGLVALLALIGAAIAYALYERHKQQQTPPTVTPTGTRVAAGTYLIRWGPAANNLYLGVPTGSGIATLVPSTSAQPWVYDLTGASNARPGGSLSTARPDAPATRFDITTSLVNTPTGQRFPAAIVVDTNAMPDLTWAIITPTGTNTSTSPSVIHNVALGGCAQPPAAPKLGDAVTLTGACGTLAAGWYLDPVTPT